MRSRPLGAVVFSAALALVLAGCPGAGSDSTSPSGNGGNDGNDNGSASIPAKVTVSPGLDSLFWITATKQLSAQVVNSSGTTLSTSVTWNSSAQNVATVSNSGLVTAVGVGSTTISAIAGSVSGSATMVVSQAPATIEKVSGDAQTATIGETLPEPLVVEVKDQGGSSIPGAELVWTVSSGGGTLVSSSSQADASGRGQATWQLGGVEGEQILFANSGNATEATFTATAQLPVVASVTVTPTTDTITSIGGTKQFTAKAFDADAAEIANVEFTWSSSDVSVADVDIEGIVTAMAEGTAQITASAGGVSASATVVVKVPPAAPLSLNGTVPSVLVEGSSAVINGAGFAATVSGNQVTLDGTPVTVTAATTSQLTVTVPTSDCLPSRNGSLKVQVGGSSASTFVGVSPSNESELAVGFVRYNTTCVTLPAGTGSEKYLVGVLSTSETVSSVTTAKLTGTSGEAVATTPAFSLVAPALDEARVGAPQAARVPMRAAMNGFGAPLTAPSSAYAGRAQAEARWRARDRATLLTLRDKVGRRLEVPSALRAPVSPVAVGDLMTLTVPGGDNLCTDGATVQGQVKYIGTGGIWVEDVNNPVEAFTSSEYQQMDQVYSSQTHPTITQYFGDFADIDNNGRTIILLTQEVNKQDGLLGFVFSGDLYPTGSCPGSNQGEIFFGLVPDPSGTVGKAWSKQDVADEYPSLVAHEVTHILQNTQVVFGPGAFKSTWEAEGGATLAEQLVGGVVNGYASGSNLGYSAWNANQDWYYAWVSDLASYYGYSNSGHITGAPEQCSWMGRTSEGNDGPCWNGRAPYGVPATLLRWILDRYGPSYSGGEKALMRQLTASSQYGLQNLATLTGDSKEKLLTLFGLALWGDDRPVPGQNLITSWNLYDIFNNLVSSAQMQTYSSGSAAPSLTVSVRAGSNAYLQWNPPSNRVPTSLKIRTSGGDALPSSMTLWVWRIQ